MKKDYIILRKGDERLKKHETLEEARIEAERLCKTESDVFTVYEAIECCEPIVHCDRRVLSKSDVEPLPDNMLLCDRCGVVLTDITGINKVKFNANLCDRCFRNKLDSTSQWHI